MKIKRSLLVGLIALLILGGFGVQQTMTAYAAGLLYEYEENNSYETANYLPLNSSISGNLSDYGDVDYYKIVTNNNGKLTIDFKHVYENNSAGWDVYTYLFVNGKIEELSQTYIGLKSNESVTLPFVGAVNNATYYIKVVRDYSTDIDGKEYTITTSFQESAYIEKEYNDSYDIATPVELGNTYSGNLSHYNDVDYYKIVPKNSGKISIDFKQRV